MTGNGDPLRRLIDLAPSQNPQEPQPPLQDPLQAKVDQFFETNRQNNRRRMMQSFTEAVKADPDLAGEAQRLGIELGADPLLVERNVDKIRGILAQRNAESFRLAHGDSMLARHLLDPSFSRIAHDQMQNLSLTEDVVANWTTGRLQIERGHLEERQALGLASDAEKARLAFVSQRLRELPLRASGFIGGLARTLGMMEEIAPEALAAGLGAGIGMAGMAATVGQAGPQALTPEELFTVPGAFLTGATVGTSSVMALRMAQVEAGLQFREMRDLGVPENVAMPVSQIVGFINGVFEVVGAGMLTRPVRAELARAVSRRVAENLARPTVGRAAGRAAVRWAQGLGGEVLTEVAQEVTSFLGENVGLKMASLASPEGRQPLVDRLGDIITETVKGTALLAVPGPSFGFYRDAQRARQAEQDARMFERLMARAAGAEVRKRNPAAYERFLGSTVREGVTDTVYVEAARLGEALQQLGLAPAEVDAIVPGLTAQVVQASPGGDVTIPTAQFAARLAGTPLGDALKPHARMSAEAPSLAELEALKPQREALAKEAEHLLQERAEVDARFVESARKVEDAFRQQLTVAGRFTDKQARAAAMFYRDFVVVRAAKLGQTAEQFHAERGLRVLGPQQVVGGEALEQFAGIRSQTANLFDFAAAKKMPGATAEEVRLATGWFQGADKMWRYEISDRNARLIPVSMKRRGEIRLGDLLEHGPLFAAYPRLADVSIDLFEESRNKKGYVDPLAGVIGVNMRLDRNEALSTLLHEIQHMVQEIEGFARGGNPALFTTDVLAKVSEKDFRRAVEEVQAKDPAAVDLFNRYVEAQKQFREHPLEMTKEEVAAADRLTQEVQDNPNASRLVLAMMQSHNLEAHEAYLRLAGEVEARNVQARQKLSLQERETAEQAPELTADIQEQGKLIFRFSSDPSAPISMHEVSTRLTKVMVAAQPNANPELLARWEKLTEEQRAQATHEILDLVVPLVLQEAGAIGSVEPQRGAWEGEPESSVAVVLEDPNNAVAVADRLGAVLHQKGMFIMSLLPGQGLQASKGVQIQLPEGYTIEQIDRLYVDKLWPLKVTGHSTQGRYMTIGTDSADTLFNQLREILDDKFGLRLVAFHSTLRTAEEHYGETATRPTGTGQPAAAGRTRDLAAEAAAVYEEVLGRFEGRAPPRPEAGAAGAEGGAVEQRGVAGAPRGLFFPEHLLAVLNKEADISTVLHEMSHYFLATTFATATEGDAADVQTLLDWFRVKDLATWNLLTLEQQRKHHESFAYNFEIWLFEGKAPSRPLEKLFERFRAWLLRIYRSIRDELNEVYRQQFGTDLPMLTPEVRGVFNRMLASEESIQQAEAVRDMTPLFQTQEQAGMTDDQWDAYRAAQEEAHEAAVTELTQASLRQMQWLRGARGRVLKNLQKQHEALRERIEKEVAEQVEAEPVYRARRWLRTGELTNAEGRTTKGEGPHRLDTEAVIALVRTEADATKLKHFATSKDGLPPDVAAEMFGFESGEALVRALLDEPVARDAIEARTDARMLAEHAEFTEGSPEQEAVIAGALHNEARARFVATELRHLAKAVQPVRVMLAAARDAAHQALLRTTVRRIRPHDFDMAEARAAKEAQRASKDGDFEAAVAALRKQLLQNQMTAQALVVREEITKARREFRRLFQDDATLAKSRDIDFVFAARALVTSFARLTDDGPLQGQEAVLADRAVERVRTEFPAVHDRLQTLRAELGGRDWRDLTLAQFRELRAIVEALWDVAKASYLLNAEGRAVELATTVADLNEQLSKLPARRAPGAQPLRTETPTPGRRLVLKAWHALASLKRVQHWVHFVDGGRRGAFTEHLLAPVMRQIDAYRAAKAGIIGRFHPRLMKLAQQAGASWDARVAAPELGYVFKGKKEVIGALLHSGSHSSLQKLLVGRTWAPDPRTIDDVLDTSNWDSFVARMFTEGRLTKADLAFVEDAWTEYKKLLPQAQKAHKAVLGYEFETIELRPLVTPFGTLEGGYAPARVDRDEVQAPRPTSVIESLEGLQQDFTYSISTGRGFTLARNPNYNQPLILDVSRQMVHFDEELRFIHLQPVVQDVLRILRKREFSDVLNAYDREAINGILLPWLDNTARQATSRPSDIPLVDWFARALRHASSMAALGFNFVNAAIQLTGFANAMTQVRGRYMRSAMLQVTTSPIDSVRTAREKSKRMDQRLDRTVEKMEQDIQRMTKAPLARGVVRMQQVSGEWAFFPQRVLQGVVDVVTWHAAYQQSVAESTVGAAQEDVEGTAVEAADLAVERSQGAQNPENLAAYEAGTPLVKLFTQFGSYSNVVFNQVLGAPGGRLLAFAWAVAAVSLFEGAIRALVAGGVKDTDDDDEYLDELAALYGRSLLRNALGLIPVVGPTLLSIAASEGDRLAAAPAGMTLQAAWRGAVGVLGGDEFTGSDARNLGTLLTLMTGLPLMPIARAAAFEVDVAAGGRGEPAGAFDHLRGLLVGR